MAALCVASVSLAAQTPAAPRSIRLHGLVEPVRSYTVSAPRLTGAPGTGPQPADRRPAGQRRHVRQARRSAGRIRSPQPAEGGPRSRGGVPRHPRADQQEARRAARRPGDARDAAETGRERRHDRGARRRRQRPGGQDRRREERADPRGSAGDAWRSCARPSSCGTAPRRPTCACSRSSAIARRTPGNMRSGTPRRCASPRRSTAWSCSRASGKGGRWRRCRRARKSARGFRFSTSSIRRRCACASTSIRPTSKACARPAVRITLDSYPVAAVQRTARDAVADRDDQHDVQPRPDVRRDVLDRRRRRASASRSRGRHRYQSGAAMSERLEARHRRCRDRWRSWPPRGDRRRESGRAAATSGRSPPRSCRRAPSSTTCRCAARFGRSARSC